METTPQMWMTKRFGITVLIIIFSLLTVPHLIVNIPAFGPSRYQVLHGNPLAWLSDSLGKSVAQNLENTPVEVIPADASASNGSDSGNSSLEGFQWLNTWNHMKQLANISDGLPHANEAIDNARTAWENLTISIHNSTSKETEKERQCPYSIRRMNASKPDNGAFSIDIPCGLIVGSSVTIIGTPGSLSGNFRIDLVGTELPGGSGKPIVLHYNVRLTSYELTGGPVIVQNAFTASNGWGYEGRCPCSNCNNATQVDDLERCNSMVGREEKRAKNSKQHLNAKKDEQPSTYFPFKQGHLAISTLRIGLEGIHMTVDGKHVTSFPYRAGLEPWFVTEVGVSGDFKLVSAIASGLPTSEDLENSFDLAMLKSSSIPEGKDVNLLIGIFSTANNFKRRMAIRRTWMQYDAVHEGAVVVRFFVGLHTNLMVNKELWHEACTYGDIQVLPFVDYYSLITWKTLAICIYGTGAVSAKYLMKTDDDAFVRVDEIHSSLKQLNVSHGLLYGRINSDSGPHRNPVQYKTDERINSDGCNDGCIVAHYQEPRHMLCMWEKLLRTNQATCCN